MSPWANSLAFPPPIYSPANGNNTAIIARTKELIPLKGLEPTRSQSLLVAVVGIMNDSRSQLLILVRGTTPWCEARKLREQRLSV